MSVQKRRQAKAIQALAARLPLTNLAGGGLIALGLYEGFQAGEGLMAIMYALVGGVVGTLVYGVIQKPVQKAENRWRAKVRELASKIESKIDEEQGGNNKLLDAYELHYLGGHPGWVVKDQSAFGTLEIFEKTLSFKNRYQRIKFGLPRLKRATIEPEHLMRLRKLPGVVLPKVRRPKNALLARVARGLERRRKYLVFDYQDDLGQKNAVVFMATLGNPMPLRPVQQAINEVLRKLPREKKGVRMQASEEVIAAAEAASRQALGPTRMYQVVIEAAGRTAEERATIAQAIAQLFHADAAKVGAALEDLPMVARRNLTQDQADRWVDSLQGVGARVRREEMGAASLP